MFGKAGTAGGQFDEAEGVAIDSKGDVWVTDYENERVQEFTENGVFLKTFGWGVSNGEAKLEVCTTSCRAGIAGSGNGQFSGPNSVTVSGTNVLVGDNNNGRVEEFNEKLEFVRSIGSFGSGKGQLEFPGGTSVDSAGNIYVADYGGNQIEKFSSNGTFLVAFGTSGSGNGQLLEPTDVDVLSSGKIYVSDAGHNRIQLWVSNSGGPHTTQTIYYTAGANSLYPACGGHAEWATLPCQEQPAKQPETSGLPSLPVSTYTYNVWGEPLTTTDTNGSSTRTTTITYDGAGRTKTTAWSAPGLTDWSAPGLTDTWIYPCFCGVWVLELGGFIRLSSGGRLSSYSSSGQS